MAKDKANGTLQKKNIIFIVLLLVVLIGGVTVGLNWNNWFGSNQATVTSNSSFKIDSNAGKKSKKAETEDSSTTGIKIPGYPTITIAKDTQDVTMALTNPEGNPCYFKFEIVLNDNDETIYESDYVPAGQTISDVTLKRPLSEGEYKATIKISTVALDKSTALNGANVKTVLIAK